MKMKDAGLSTIKQFFKENRTLIFSIPILIVLVITVLIIYSNLGGAKSSDSIPAIAESSTGQLQGNRVEILPQKERTLEDSSTSANAGTAIKDPFTAPLMLVGVVIDSNGNNVAIIEGNSKSYIVKKDDILNSNMVVKSIEAGVVILKEGDREITLKLEQRKNNQTVAK